MGNFTSHSIEYPASKNLDFSQLDWTGLKCLRVFSVLAEASYKICIHYIAAGVVGTYVSKKDSESRLFLSSAQVYRIFFNTLFQILG